MADFVLTDDDRRNADVEGDTALGKYRLSAAGDDIGQFPDRILHVASNCKCIFTSQTIIDEQSARFRKRE